MLSIRGLRKSYGPVLALADLDLEVRPGTVLGLVGSNGAGKSTTIDLVTGLVEPDAGVVRIGGRDRRGAPRSLSREIGVAAQETALYPLLSGRRNLEFFARVHGLSPRTARSRAAAALESLGLEEVADRPCTALSGGERRCVHVAAAMVHRPSLLLLDEPTVGLDAHRRDRLLAWIGECAADGVAVCFSSHYLTEIERACEDLVVLDRGHVVESGTVRDVVGRRSDGRLEITFSDGTVLHRTGGTLSAVLAELGPKAEDVRSVDVRLPSLEEAFFALTGPGDAGARASVDDDTSGG